MRTADPWLTRLRALVGTGVLAWELTVQQGRQWWIFVLVVWLLGGPVEEVIRLLTVGRVAISVNRKNDDPPED